MCVCFVVFVFGACVDCCDCCEDGLSLVRVLCARLCGCIVLWRLL